jgi:hypothetical protein
MTYSGKYNPQNPEKYKGKIQEIYYRSSWELSIMMFCDTNPNIVQWGSESVVIPYLSPIDGRRHRYFVDFWIKSSSGAIKLIEVKPKKQVVKPKKRKATKGYINEVKTWIKNDAKWKAAEEYALDRGWIFEIWTEDTLKILGIKIP